MAGPPDEADPPDDAASGPDASTPDAATPDASTPDASGPDAPATDTATPDTATPDTATPDTATPDAPAAAEPIRRPWGWILLGLVALVVAALAIARGGSQTARDGDAPPGGELAQDAALEDGPVARVQGQVWLEVEEEAPQVEPEPPPDPTPVVVIEDGRVRVLDPSADETGTGADTGEVAPLGDPPGPETMTSTGGRVEPEAQRDDDAEPPLRGDEGEVDPSALPPEDRPPEPEPEPAPDPAADDEAPPKVELEPPQAGTCRVIAWQKGVKVGGPQTCDDEGRFEVALDPGISGPTAFEILVPGRLRAVVEVDVPRGGHGRLPAVALGVAQTLAGQVVDGRGTPVPGVAIAAMPSPDLGEPEPWRTTTDAEGRFLIDTLPPGPIGLRATAEGYAPTVLEAIAPADDVLVVLDALMTMRGKVVGEPDRLARARVRIEGSGVWPAREVPVQPDGSFAFPDVPDGVYALEAIVPAASPGDPEYASFPLENVAPDLEATLALVEAFRVPVQVVDPSGAPVADARVTLGNAAIGMLQRVATTDAEGRVRIGPVVPGPYVLRADAEGFLPPVPIAVTVDGPDVPEQILRMSQPGRIAGVVLDENERPVDGARVEVVAEALFTVGESQARARLLKEALATDAAATGSLGVTTGPVPPIPSIAEEDPGISDVVTDTDGTFSISMLPPGEYRLVASHGHYAESAPITVTLRAGEQRGGIVLTLRTGQPLTGRVLEGNDHPIAGAQVFLPEGAVLTTDRRGVFDAGPRTGPVRLVVRARGMAPTERTIVVRDRPVDVDIVLEAADGELTGRIEGENGEVLADARVTLRMLDGLSPTQIAWTDARGVYLFAELPLGPGELVVDHPGHGEVVREVDVQRGRDFVDVALPVGWSVEVDVRAENSGDPLEGVQVTAGAHHGITDADGRARIDNLVDDRVTVEVQSHGWGSGRARVARPESGVVPEVRFTLREGGGIAGRVTDYRGDPVEGALVVAYTTDADPRELGRAETDAEGGYEIDGVREGDVELVADPPPEREDDLAQAALSTDVLRGHVTRGADLRFDRR